eukprot:SAG11_NODE_451_length_9386_cov_42.557661_6_plen_252_part_00
MRKWSNRKPKHSACVVAPKTVGQQQKLSALGGAPRLTEVVAVVEVACPKDVIELPGQVDGDVADPRTCRMHAAGYRSAMRRMDLTPIPATRGLRRAIVDRHFLTHLPEYGVPCSSAPRIAPHPRGARGARRQNRTKSRGSGALRRCRPCSGRDCRRPSLSCSSHSREYGSGSRSSQILAACAADTRLAQARPAGFGQKHTASAQRNRPCSHHPGLRAAAYIGSPAVAASCLRSGRPIAAGRRAGISSCVPT